MKIKITETPKGKMLRSERYNFNFDKQTGFFIRWGKDENDDPEFGLPEIADIEVTTICHGAGGKLCSFCYKSNTPDGINMSFETFKTVFDKLPKSVTQIAFGADASATANPDLFKMMKYSRENGVIPNITVADITDETADKLSKLCGAVSVSFYGKDTCYGSIQKLVSRGMKQVNAHIMIAEESFEKALGFISDMKTDERLKGMNAAVFLSLKQKGRGTSFNPLSMEKFRILVDTALEAGISFGFDSCGCAKFLKSVENHPKYKEFKTMSEPCESLCFSMYCDASAHFYPCSFTEGINEWEEGIDLTKINDFIKDVWFHPKVREYRQKIIDTRNACKACFYYDV